MCLRTNGRRLTQMNAQKVSVVQYQEDPRKKKNFSLGLKAEISLTVVPKQRRIEKDLKMAGDKNKTAILELLLSLLSLTTVFRHNFHNN